MSPQIVVDYISDEPPEMIQAALPDVTVTQPDWPATGDVTTSTIAPAPLQLKVPVAQPTRLVSLYIRRREDEKLVAVIELLSPVNKRPGEGRQQYLEKRTTFLGTGIHFIEIDLLRKWPRMPLEGSLPASAYLALVRDAYRPLICDVWPIGLRQPLPVLPVPLLRPDPVVPLDMGQALRTAYERARYDLRIDYNAPSNPSLSPEDAAWAADLTT